MALDNNLIQEFRNITRYNLQLYLLAIKEFSDQHYGKLLSYYSGVQEKIPSDSVKLLDTLVIESKRLDYIIQLNVRRFSTTDWWDLLEVIEEAKTKLETISNSPKWTRTSYVLAKKVEKPTFKVQLLQNQTLERLLGGDMGHTDENQSWYETAILNDLKEEDYTPGGGTSIEVSRESNISPSVQSVVDIINSETIKGKDINQVLSFVDDDLDVVEGDDCFLQSVKNLLELKKGDNPEFVEQGLSKSLVSGQNINSISYPILIRQITQVLRSDDTIESFSLTKIERHQDGIFIEMDIIGRGDNEFKISSVI